ncbi:uncharacterized protein EDB91DRAFT_1227280 [Suillus paluster]|uniref:uncharacterized protein n=1 Tax=Suillus paluster TaxID=48578 RepID=UPI001B87B32F|nr:uncharacterized protein EDB91DRAFT_1227280 [Suillus paluster]KAG1731071.1 hypothetical protein EDB91DRAFT_1227280 [Suillus paluster]
MLGQLVLWLATFLPPLGLTVTLDSAAVTGVASSFGPTVTLDSATITGVWSGPVNKWLGIPYALPPPPTSSKPSSTITIPVPKIA